MGKILIFEEIEEQALALGDEDKLILFGEKNYVNDGNNIYDLIFLCMSNRVPKVNDQVVSMVMPVLAYKGNRGIGLVLANEYLDQHPEIRHMALSNSEFLEFFENSDNICVHLGKYNTTRKDLFMAHIQDNSDLVKEMSRSIELINSTYDN